MPSEAASRAAGVSVSLVGCVVLLGWALDVESLKRIAPGLVAMNPATAVSLVLAGIALSLITVPRRASRVVASVCGAAVLAVGACKLTAVFTPVDLGIDRLLFQGKLNGPNNPIPNRMAPNTALNLVLLGSALLLTLGGGPRRRWIGRALTVFSAFLSLLAILGYASGIKSLYGVSSFIPMALHTAIAFVLLAVGILLVRADEAWAGVSGRFFWKLYGGYVALIVVSTAIVGVMVNARVERNLSDDTRVRLHDTAALLGEYVLQALTDSGSVLDNHRLKEIGGNRSVRLTVMRADGTVIGDSLVDATKMGSRSDRPEIAAARTGDVGIARRRSTSVDREMLYVAVPVRVDGRLVGFARTALDTAAIDGKLAEVRGSVIMGATFAGAIALVMGFFVARRVTAPLASMTELADAIASGDLRQSLTVRSRDEFGRLAASINKMVVQLAERERKLRESEQEYRATFEVAAVGKAQADPKTGRFLRVNRKLCQITGYSAEELLSMTFPQLTHPAEREADLKKFKRLVTGEAAEYAVEKRYLHKDGRVVWVSVNATLIRDEQGRPQRTIAVIHDITARKQVEESLRESEERFRQLAENIREVFWMTTPDGHKVFYVSPAYEKVWGRSCQSLYDNPADWLNGIHEEDRGRATAAWIDMVHTGQYQTEYRVVRPDGSVRWILDRCPGQPGRGVPGRGDRLGHHGDQGGGSRVERRQGHRRGGEPSQKRLPRQYEPRNPNADDRDHRVFGPAAGTGAVGQ